MKEEADIQSGCVSDERYDGTVTVGAGGTVKIAFVTVIGQIEGHFLLGDNQKTTKYEHLIPLFAQADEDPAVGGVMVILNTVGGDVEAGLAIAELIASLAKPTVSLVLGGGHSIGVPLAVAADRSFIVPSATMTLHPVRINGLVLGAPQSYDYLNRMQDRIVNFISSHSGCPPEVLRRMMMRTDAVATDMGCILEGAEAVGAGLIDEEGGMKEAVSWLRKAMNGEI